MKRNSEFHDYVVHDLLGRIPGISSRPMFSGYGIYQHGNIFAIIIADELYFKATAQTQDYFEKQGSHPFAYTKKNGKTYTMNYWLVPEEIMEDREKFEEWMGITTGASS